MGRQRPEPAARVKAAEGSQGTLLKDVFEKDPADQEAAQNEEELDTQKAQDVVSRAQVETGPAKEKRQAVSDQDETDGQAAHDVEAEVARRERAGHSAGTLRPDPIRAVAGQPSKPSPHALMGTIAALALVTAFPLAAEKPDVRARVIVPASLPAGARAPLSVELTLGPGWHVNSHTPSETFLIPTDLALTTSAGTLSPVRYPAQVERRFSFSEKPLRVYEGTVRFETDLELPAAAAGNVAIAGSLSYQACNDQQCYAPSKIPLNATIVIASPTSSRPN